MFKYAVKATASGKPFRVVALTNYKDLAEYICENCAAALDPSGERGMIVKVEARPEADFFINPYQFNGEV